MSVEISKEFLSDIRTLHDDVWPVEYNLKKTCILLQEILEEYFQVSDKNDDNRCFRICYDFEKMGIYAEMAFDYAHAAEVKIRALEEKAESFIARISPRLEYFKE